MRVFRRRTHLFRVIGQFVAKAMLDSRIIDMSFSKVFLKMVLAEDIPLSIDTLMVSCLLVIFQIILSTVIACGSRAGAVTDQASRICVGVK